MTTKERYDGIIAWFSEHMPVAESELHYTDPYQLLVAVILSAQCTDKRVNMTTPALFEAFPTPFDMAAATAEDIYPYIKSISYPNNKARNLAGMARMLCSEFGGEVPSDLQQMQRLPGVGRKTANVLIFERIREEIRQGLKPLEAVAVGFDRATISIVDSNLTTIIAAAILYQFGTGPVRGFAVTLSLGIVASMFTAIFVSRTAFGLWLGGNDGKKLSI